MVLVLLLSLVAPLLSAQSGTDEAMWKIRKEVAQSNRALGLVTTMSDLFPTRLTGSSSLARAREWVMQQLRLSGLENARLDPWDFDGSGWENERASCRIVAPVRVSVPCAPVAWTPGTQGPTSADVALIRLPIGMSEAQLADWFVREQPRLNGRVVLLESPTELPRIPAAPEIRLDSDKLTPYRSLNPGTRTTSGRVRTSGSATAPMSVASYHALVDRLLVKVGVIGRIYDSALPDGLLRAFANSTFNIKEAAPSVAIRNEDYAWIARLLASGLDVRMELTLDNQEVPAGRSEFNVIGTLRGNEPSAGTIVVGAHLDSWHVGRGATDNAAGVALVLEAARILAGLNDTPRRTIAFAFWTGEEQGLLGSTAHAGKYAKSKERPPVAYVNVDGGGGRIRAASVYADGDAVADRLTEVFARLTDLEVVGAISASGPGPTDSDHFSFGSIGVPSVRFEHDPLRFRTHTWHTDIDTPERLVDTELNASVIILTTSLLQLANGKL